MSTTASHRGTWIRRLSSVVRHAVLPLLWLLTLGYQWALAAWVLGTWSQLMAEYFHDHPRLDVSATWERLCGAYEAVFLVSLAFWLAACPRAITAALSKDKDQPWAQRRLARTVLLVLSVGLLMQSAWLIGVLQTHATGVALAEEIVARIALRYEAYLPWPFLFGTLLPLVAWSVAYAVGRQSSSAAYFRVGVWWALLLFVGLNVAVVLSQARRLAYYHFENEPALTLAKYVTVVIVGAALLFEYRQSWQAALARLSDRKRGAEPLISRPQALIPDP